MGGTDRILLLGASKEMAPTAVSTSKVLTVNFFIKDCAFVNVNN